MKESPCKSCGWSQSKMDAIVFWFIVSMVASFGTGLSVGVFYGH